MTAQIGDIYKRNSKQYQIVAMSVAMPFKPSDYGLEAHARSSACWNGYWCEYDITDDGLFLQNLFIFNKDDNYPTFNGVEISPQEYSEMECITGKGKKKVKHELHNGHREYKNVNLRMPYTGRILVGDEFLWDYYIHMGYQRSWAYKVLIEFVFEDGILLDVIDHSKYAALQRERIKLEGDDSEASEDIEKFVQDSFSLDYSRKAWWIKER